MKKKKYLIKLGLFSIASLPIAIVVACSNNNENSNIKQENQNESSESIKDNNSEIKEKNFVFDETLLDKFPKNIMISFTSDTSEQLIKSKIKVAIDKDTKDLSREDKQAFNFFLENYFDNGKLDTKEETFTIKYDDYEYVIKYEKGNIVEVKIDFESNDNKEQIISKIVKEIDNLGSADRHDLGHIFEFHSLDGEFIKAKQKLVYPSIHDGLPYTIYYKQK